MLWCHQFFTQGHKAASSTTRVIGFVVLAQIEFTLRCVCCRQCELSSSMTAVKVTRTVRGEVLMVGKRRKRRRRGRGQWFRGQIPLLLKISDRIKYICINCLNKCSSVYAGYQRQELIWNDNLALQVKVPRVWCKSGGSLVALMVLWAQ